MDIAPITHAGTTSPKAVDPKLLQAARGFEELLTRQLGQALAAVSDGGGFGLAHQLAASLSTEESR
jgi:hypothetical protein